MKSILVIFFTLYSLESMALTCQRVFTFSPIDSLERIENQMLQIDRDIMASEVPPKVKGALLDSLTPNIERFRVQIDRALDDIFNQGTKHLSLIRSLRRKVSDLSEKYITHIDAEKNYKFSMLIENPKYTIADRIYEIKDTNGRFTGVLFESSIVEDIFQSKDSKCERCSNAVLKNIQRGFVRRKGGAGIEKLSYDTNAYEVRIKGQNIGNLRLGGYFHDHIFYVVTYGIGEHTAKFYSLLTQRIVSRRNARGH